MRDARSGTSRTVRLEAFEIGRSPVTEGEFWAVHAGGAGGADSSDRVATAVAVPRHPVTWFDAARWCNAASATVGLHPAYVVRERAVAWDVAADGFRLPTEAEWEWACRAGTEGPTYGPLAEIAWTEATASPRRSPSAASSLSWSGG